MIKGIYKYSFAAAVICLVTNCSDNNKQNKQTEGETQQQPQQQEQANATFITPAFKNIDIPVTKYTFDAEKGDTLFHPSGSIVMFPANSLVDKDGKVVKGKVEITYREFSDPLDFFISGIPMAYDSAGTNYTFESAGMCDINAYQNNTPLYVNQENKPQVHLASPDKDTAFNVYFLDTGKKSWINKGKDMISDARAKASKKSASKTSENVNLPKPPVKPTKASGSRPSFSIDVEQGIVSELQAYDNLKFEIDADEKGYKPEDANEEWTDVKVEKGPKDGTYIVSFINAKRKVSYLTRPVFEGQDYDKALKIFEEKNKEYNQLVAARLEKEKSINEKNQKQLQENEKIASSNLLIEARNKEYEAKLKQIKERNKQIEAQNKQIAADNKQVEAKNKQLAAQNREIEARNQQILQERKNNKPIEEMTEVELLDLEKVLKEAERRSAILRTFELDGFGIWNSDKPVLQQGIPILATFKDKSGKKLALSPITLVYKGFNGITQYYDANIKAMPGSETMLWSVVEDKLVYLSYDEFKKCNLGESVKEYTFTMNVHPQPITSIEDIKKVLTQ